MRETMNTLLIDSRTGEKYLAGIEFDLKRIDELLRLVNHEAKYIDLHIEGENSFLKLLICFTDEEIEIKNGNYLLRSEKIIPGTIPPMHYYKSVEKEEFCKNFKPFSVTKQPSIS